MKHSIFFLSLLCGMTACCTHEKENKQTGDPIENLIYYLDKQGEHDVTKCEQYEGGSILRKAAYYSINYSNPNLVTKWQRKHDNGSYLAADSSLRAFSWGCSGARQCYHKESHVADKDSVVYALALDPMEGERIELYGKDSYHAQFKAARAATLTYEGDREHTFVCVEYITREEKGEAEPYDEQPIIDFINKEVELTDSLKTYEVSYEFTAEDYQKRWGNQPFVAESYYDEEHTLYSKSTGHLYVIPVSKAKSMFHELQFMAKDKYILSHPNQEFRINTTPRSVIIRINDLKDWPYKSKNTNRHKSLHSFLSDMDGHFYILVIDETIGAFTLPGEWYKVLRVKDHKIEYIPGYKPQG